MTEKKRERHDALLIREPIKLLVDGEPEAKRMRWMIGARDRMEKVASIGVFIEGTKIVVAIPLLETSEGAALDVTFAAEVIGKAALAALNDVIDRQARRLKRAKKRADASKRESSDVPNGTED